VPTPGNRRYERALSTLNAVAEAIIAAHDPGGDTVVSRLLQAKTHVEGVDDEQIRNEVLTLLIAGHETTALALSYTCFLLASNPTQAERLRVELDAALDDDAPTLPTLDDLAYTKRVVREAMRLYPPVPALSREVAEPVTLGGYEFRPGETVSMQQWVLHRDPRYYDAPTAFRPARWDDDLQASLPRFAYFPFGGGPRRCIGDTFARQEAHLAVATIARDWTFDAVTDTLSFDPMLTLRPDGPVKLRVHQR
jgi:cytochrome P450